MFYSFSHYESPSFFLLILALAVTTSNGLAALPVNSTVLAASDRLSSPHTGLHPSTAGNVHRVDPKNGGAGGTGSPRIAFGSVRNSGNHDIFLMDLDGTNQIRITNDPAYDDQPKWSPDGSRIAFMSNRDGNFEIYTMNADGSAQTRVTNNLMGDGFPAWSHDGKKIAFVRGDLRNPRTFEIFVMNADGGNQIQLSRMTLLSMECPPGPRTIQKSSS